MISLAPTDKPNTLLEGLFGLRETVVVTDLDTCSTAQATADLYPEPPFYVRARDDLGFAIFVAITLYDAVVGDLGSLPLEPSFLLAQPHDGKPWSAGEAEVEGRLFELYALYKLPQETDAELVANHFGQLGWSTRWQYPCPGTAGCRLLGGHGRSYSLARLRRDFPELCR